MKINNNLIGKKVRVIYSYYLNPIMITGILEYVNENGDIRIKEKDSYPALLVNSWIISIVEIK
jgi:hypothetical protein